jgi:3-oxoacyl-[acyl-carrier-protein] synthase-3
MNGPEILVFALAAATKAVSELLEKTRARVDDVDRFVFHQGGKQMLDGLRRKCGISEERFLVHMRDVGNTASPSIPIVLTEAGCSGRLQPGHLVMLVGFGVGLSWGATLVRWPTK